MGPSVVVLVISQDTRILCLNLEILNVFFLRILMSEAGVRPPLGIGGRGAVGARPVSAPRVVDVDVVVGVVAFASA